MDMICNWCKQDKPPRDYVLEVSKTGRRHRRKTCRKCRADKIKASAQYAAKRKQRKVAAQAKENWRWKELENSVMPLARETRLLIYKPLARAA